MRPKRVACGQGLGAEHVEHGPGHLARLQQRQQVFFHQMAAPGNVNQVGTTLQLRQGVAVEDVFGLGRERQQVDQHAGARQKRGQLLRAAKALHACDLLGAAAPAQDRKLKLRHRLRHPRAQHAQAQDAHRKIRTRQRLAKRPVSCAGIGLVGVKFAGVADQRVAHVFGHLHRHAGVVQAHKLGLGGHLQRQQCVHPRANIERRLELRLLVKQGLRRRPDHGVVGGRIAAVPEAHVRMRQRGLQALQPGFGLGVGAAKSDAHGRWAQFKKGKRPQAATATARRNNSAPSATWSPGA